MCNNGSTEESNVCVIVAQQRGLTYVYQQLNRGAKSMCNSGSTEVHVVCLRVAQKKGLTYV